MTNVTATFVCLAAVIFGSVRLHAQAQSAFRNAPRAEQLLFNHCSSCHGEDSQRGDVRPDKLGAMPLTELLALLDRMREQAYLGGVRLDGNPLAPEWDAQFRAVAKRPKVRWKVSALFGRWEKQTASQDIAACTEVLDLAFECFGEGRLIFGSDWPVSEQTVDYAAALRLTRAYFDHQDSAVSEKLFHQNAAAFYRPPTPK